MESNKNNHWKKGAVCYVATLLNNALAVMRSYADKSTVEVVVDGPRTCDSIIGPPSLTTFHDAYKRARSYINFLKIFEIPTGELSALHRTVEELGERGKLSDWDYNKGTRVLKINNLNSPINNWHQI